MIINLTRAETQELQEITKIIRQAFSKSKYDVNINPYRRELNSQQYKDKLRDKKIIIQAKELEKEIKKMFDIKEQELKMRRKLNKANRKGENYDN